MVLPNLIIPGFPKTATTSLVSYLNFSPEVFIPIKELRFFYLDKEYNKGLNYYSKYFDNAFEKKIVGENSNIYIFSDKALNRIFTHFKDLKIIICLRNPIDRALSQYNFAREKGTEFLSPYLAIKTEKFRTMLPHRFFKNNYSYIKRGLYYDYIIKLSNYVELSSIHFFVFENFIMNPQKELEKISAYLNIDTTFIKDIDFSKQRNVTKNIKYPLINLPITIYKKYFWKKNKFKIIEKMLFTIEEKNIGNEKKRFSNKFRQQLIEYYKPHNKKLQELINIDLSIWEK